MYTFIKMRGPDSANTGYFVHRMYKLTGLRYGLKIFGFSYIKDRLNGWTYWWVNDEADFENAKKALKELRKTRIFEYLVLK